MGEKLWADDVLAIFRVVFFHIIMQSIYPHDWEAPQDTPVTTQSLRSKEPC